MTLQTSEDPTMHLPRILAALALAAALAPGAARAAHGFDNCTGFIDSLPATLSTQGTWCLRKDLASAQTAGAAITIATNNVTIDCNDFKIGGLAAGPATGATGILANHRLNATVRRCSIRGFRAGLDFSDIDAGGHLVEDNRFEANTSLGLNVEGDGSLVRRNVVRDTGGTMGDAVGLRVAGDVDVRDNTIAGVAPLAAEDGSAMAAGILTYLNSSGTIRGNRVRGLVPLGPGLSYGILNSMSGHISVQDNLMATQVQGHYGVLCSNGQARLQDNIVNGFANGQSGCSSLQSNDFTP